jgi:hypothetical protein
MPPIISTGPSTGLGTVEPKSGEIYGNLKENLPKSLIFRPENQG